MFITLGMFVAGGVAYGKSLAQAEADKAMGEARQARYDLEDEKRKRRGKKWHKKHSLPIATLPLQREPVYAYQEPTVNQRAAIIAARTQEIIADRIARGLPPNP